MTTASNIGAMNDRSLPVSSIISPSSPSTALLSALVTLSSRRPEPAWPAPTHLTHIGTDRVAADVRRFTPGCLPRILASVIWLGPHWTPGGEFIQVALLVSHVQVHYAYEAVYRGKQKRSGRRGWSEATGARLDLGVTPDHGLAILPV